MFRFLSCKPAKPALVTCLPFGYSKTSREKGHLFGTFTASMDEILQKQCDVKDRTKGLLGGTYAVLCGFSGPL